MLLGAIPPLMLKTDANPDGLPIEAFDEIRAGVAGDRSQFYRDLAAVLRRQPAGLEVSQGMRDAFWLHVDDGRHQAAPTTASTRSRKPTSPRT